MTSVDREPRERPPAVADPDQLIDASEVADILGLAHRNSVSTYRSRYSDFPQGQPSPHGSRVRVWRRGDVLAWQASFRRKRAEPVAEDSPRLRELVDATARLLLAKPGTDISIRQIAAEAGVAHSDLYRYATSKHELRHLALDAVSNDFAEAMPTSYAALVESVPVLIQRTKEQRPLIAVLAHEMISGPARPLSHELAVAAVAKVLAEHRASTGSSSSVDPRVVGACLGAMMWGLWLFEERWLAGLDLAEIPIDQVATVVRALLEA